MGKIPRLVLWLCRKFTRQELQELVHELEEILAGRQPEPQPRDDFRRNIRIIAISPSILWLP